MPRVREVFNTSEADGTLVHRFGSGSTGSEDREGKAQTGGMRSLAEARKLLRQLRVEILAALEAEISIMQSQADPAVLFEAIVTELARTLATGNVDKERIDRIAAHHDQARVSLEGYARIYGIVQEGLVDKLSQGEVAALVRHENLLVTSLTRSLRIRLMRAESLHSLLVQFVARLDDWAAGDEVSFLDEVTSLIAQVTSARLVAVLEGSGSPELGYLNEPLRVRAVHGPAAGYFQEVTLFVSEAVKGGRGPISAAFRTGEVKSVDRRRFLSLLKPDERASFENRFESYGIGSLIAAPFAMSSASTGVLAIYGGLEDPLPDDVTEVVSGLGAELSKVFEVRTSRRQGDRHRKMHDVDLLISTSLQSDVLALIEDVMQALAAGQLVKYAMVLASNEEGSSLVPVGTYGTSTALIESLAGIVFDVSSDELDELGVMRVLRTGEPVVSMGLELPAAVARALSPSVLELVKRNVIARLPVTVSGRVVGVVVASADGKTAHDVDLRGFEFVTTCIEAAKARASHNREVAESAWLSQIYRTLLSTATAMVGAQSSDDLFREFCSALVSGGFFSAAWVAIPDHRRNRLVPAAVAGQATAWLSDVVIPLDHPGLGPNALRAFRSDATFSGENELTDPELAPWVEQLSAGGWGSVGAVPLHRRGRVMGSLTVVSPQPYAFSPAVMALVETVAQMIDQVLLNMDLRDDLDEERIREQRAARTDYLTEIPNRGAFEEAVDSALRNRGDRFVAIGILDLDGFKDYNDALGSRAGDALLKLVGRRLVNSVSKDEFVARLGGDEFGVCVSIESAAALSRVARRIESCVDSVKAAPDVSFSMGWAIAPHDGHTFEPLYGRADQALRAAKSGGRARFYLFGGQVARESELRLEVRSLLPRAIAEGSLEFACQPKIDARTGNMVGLEMLLRWDRLPLPAVIAETRRDPGLARALGRYVIASAREVRRTLDEHGLASVDVSINISPSHFQSDSFLSDTRPLWELAGGRVIIEVTEDAALDDLVHARKTIEGLHEHGLALSLDDFGTGYASLSNIAGLHIDEIKVDRSFLMTFSSDNNAFAVVNSLIMLGDLSGTVVIGEGIETEEQLHLWLRLGGRYVQGYWYARPMSLGDVISYAKDPPCAPRTETRFPLEDLPFVAYLEGIGSYDLVASERSCRLDAWFRNRRWRWQNLMHFQEALALHEWMHSDDGLRVLHGPKRGICEADLVRILTVLEREIEGTLAESVVTRM